MHSKDFGQACDNGQQLYELWLNGNELAKRMVYEAVVLGYAVPANDMGRLAGQYAAEKIKAYLKAQAH